MLRRDTNASFEKTGAWLFSRYRFTSGGLEAPKALGAGAHKRLLAEQLETPIALMTDEARRRTWWMFAGDFYWDDDGYDATTVKALVLERLNQRDRRVKRAVALMEQRESIETATRERIADEVRVFVWNRDKGACVRCGSQERLEFDHIIPVVLGGANTARNLQLLCEVCNRSKGASI
jgi:hypothetical protein